jgi:5'-methylthioadenosine phosphorylase
VRARLALIGGSGVEGLDVLKDASETEIETPYGSTSGSIRVGRVGSAEVAFLMRHGPGHAIPPHRINHRANVWALRELGVRRIVALSSVGSLRRDLRPGSLAVPHDYLCLSDLPTFFDDKVVHATPALDEPARKVLLAAAKRSGFSARARAVYAQTRGPRLETKAEIRMLSDYADVVGMTMASEATLAAEAGLGYACLCTVDNYAHGIAAKSLSYEEIRKGAKRNADKVAALLPDVLRGLAAKKV